MRKPLRRPSPAMVVACLALFVASTGTSIAASHYLITSTKQIKPSVLTKLKGAKGAKGDTGANGTAGATGAQGLKGDTGAQGLKGDTGAQGLKGDTGAQGAAGTNGTARAYGLVASDGTLTQSKNATVAHPQTGVYCIAPAAGIDSATTVLVVTPAYGGGNATNLSGGHADQTVVEWVKSPGTDCPAGDLEAATGYRHILTAIVSSTTVVTSANLILADQGFSFVIP